MEHRFIIANFEYAGFSRIIRDDVAAMTGMGDGKANLPMSWRATDG